MPADAALRAALREDRVGFDRTSRALFPRPRWVRADIIAQGSGIVSGLAVAQRLARLVGVRCEAAARDGARVRHGSRVLTLTGDVRRVLSVERTLLNYLMHLSGVASATARAVQAAGPNGPRVYATRKTLPGLRDVEKAAVVHGGGHPHRRDLSGAVLIKTPHLEIVPLDEAIRRARAKTAPGVVIEVEVQRPTEAVRAARAGANAVLLDNRTPGQVRAIVRALEAAGLRSRVWVEISGGITVERLPRFRGTGADAASLGSLTHSAPALPFHLVLRAPRARGRLG